MKTGLWRMTIRVVVLAGCVSLGAWNAPANWEVSVGVQITSSADFYEPLGGYGTWVETGPYGRCWHPSYVAVAWRPYCAGTWVWTDCGWYWESDEPWAWACYHYGTWVDDPTYGWVWVPGVEWAPAWVYWRMGGGYVGWAPCAPVGVAVVPATFVFVEQGRFHDRVGPKTVIINNPVIINQTVRITDSRREHREIDGRQQTVIVNRGPDVAVIEKATGKKFKEMPVQEADRQTVVPMEVKHRTVHEQHTAAPTPTPTPDRSAAPPSPPTPSHATTPDRTGPPAHHETTPSGPPANVAPSKHETPPAKGNGNGSDSGSDHGPKKDKDRDNN